MSKRSSRKTLGRLALLCKKLPDYDVEIICVDDGSRDKTYDLLRAAAETRPELRIVRFSRNFGHQIAVTAGIDAAAGDAIVLMDSDLQDPPEVVIDMVAKWEEGFDVVYGVRTSRAGETASQVGDGARFLPLPQHPFRSADPARHWRFPLDEPSRRRRAEGHAGTPSFRARHGSLDRLQADSLAL